MRFATIDLGTNSVRFDVHEIRPDQSVARLHREKLMVRLGQGVFLGGRLDPEAVRRTIQAFQSFSATATQLRAARVVAYGTSALREAADSSRLLELVRERTGIEIRVISGREEALLIARGILKNEPKLQKGRFALVDIGGGSTEVSLVRDGKIIRAMSFDLGAARLHQIFLRSSPPSGAPGEPHPIALLRRHIQEVFRPGKGGWPKVKTIVGSSGTIRALYRIHRKSPEGGKGPLTRASLTQLVSGLSGMTTEQLLLVPGMEPKRVDIILAGAVLLDEISRMLAADRVVSTEFSLRDGLLDEARRGLKPETRSRPGFDPEALAIKAKQLGAGESHPKKVVALASDLFDELRPLHRLNPTWKTYLLGAAMFHDVGKSVSLVNHEKHSFYIAKNADIPGLAPWEADFIGRLCLYHKEGKVDETAFEFGEDQSRKDAFFRLLAILRLADALDRGRRGHVKLESVEIKPDEVHLILSGGPSIELEILRLEQKKDLFVKLFGRSLSASRK